MNEFSHLSVIIAMILGSGMVQLVTGLGRIIVQREKICLYWPTVTWIALLLVLHVLLWWTMFLLRDSRGWNFLVFSVVLLQPLILYFLAALILSAFTMGESRVDLKESYYENARWFFSLFVLFFCASLLKDLALYGRLPERVNLAAHLIWIVLGVGAISIRSEWYHKLLILMSVALTIAYIATLFPRLPSPGVTYSW